MVQGMHTMTNILRILTSIVVPSSQLVADRHPRQICLASEVLYNFSIALSRVSVVLFYRRIFSIDGHYSIFTRVMLFCIPASGLAAVIGLICTDDPVRAQWNVLLPHTSINTNAFYEANAAINIVFDLAIYGLVQHKVWHLKVSMDRKILLSLLLLVAAL